MPYYRFQVDSPLPPKTIAARIHAITRESRGLLEYFRRGRPTNPPGPGFLGRVKDLSFRLQRDIRYSNSFLPVIRGRITPDIVGSKVTVTMYLPPTAAVFMAFWLSGIGYLAWQQLSKPHISDVSDVIAPVAGFVIGLAITLGGFFFEAIKAKRLLQSAISEPGA